MFNKLMDRSGRLAMDRTWIVVSDGRRARIFQLDEPQDSLSQVETLDWSGDQGDTDTAAAHRHDTQRSQPEAGLLPVQPAHSDSMDFTGAISDRLDRLYRRKRFDRLALVAPPEILPEWLDKLSPQLRGALILEMEADMMEESPSRIRSSLSL
jgi:protein required for attachment to host cells